MLCRISTELYNSWDIYNVTRLLLQGGIVQRFPFTVAIFWSITRLHLSSNHSRFISQFSLVAAETSTEAGS
jgi:hypothetical protein